MKRIKIEIEFPFPVEVPHSLIVKIENAVKEEICESYEASNPDCVMWPCEYGSKITYLPMTMDEEVARGIEFDDSIFSIRVCERRKQHGM